jgi:pyruvate formate-lyase/glycerol dehydratase family glycyl radical enzyme
MEPELASPERMANTRVGRIRDRIIEAPQEVCVERARFFTRAMERHWEKDPLTRMSLGLEHVLKNISVTIRKEELVVGCRTAKLKGAPLFPENKNRWIAGDVDNFDHRQVQRALITEAEKKELKEAIIPFWEGKSVEDDFENRIPQDVAEDIDKYIFTFMLEITYGIGHFTMNHERVMSHGLGGVIAGAEKKYHALSREDQAGEKGLFYQAAIRSMKSVISFANRYADRASEMAQEENDPDRAEELLTIARNCRRVPEHPPDGFHEAVQFLYFIHLVVQIESGGNSVSLGRIDQYLYPYYQRDLEAGHLDPGQARELISLVFLKTNEIWNVLEEAYIPGGEGTEGKTTQNVTVGGLGRDGEDATNELSRVVMNAYADIRTVQPNFGVRLSDQSDDLFFMQAVEYARDGVLLHFFGDEAIVTSLTAAGHTLEDARDYGMVGCLEPNAQGKTFASTFAVQFNGTKCLEFALSNGVDNIFGYPAGLLTGDPKDFGSFDEVWAAYHSQVSHYMAQMVRGITCLDEAIARRVPSPFASAMIDGPLEKGLDLTRGGAIYNSTGVQFMGFSNVADSLYSVKKEVFQEKTFSMEDLAQWLCDDWTDAEERRLYLLNKVPKYGNDHDGPDAMAARVMNHFCDVLAQHRNFRGGAFWPGIFSVGFHITMGAFSGASPDGRFAGDHLGNGISPSNGAAVLGPTALINSVIKLPLTRVTNGLNLNMRFDGKRIKREALLALLKTYFRHGGVQVQFNMVDVDTLIAARERPDQYRDLIVRISGYSGFFVDLSDIAQDEIISRMEYDI